MGLAVSELHLASFRNLKDRDIAFSPSTTILVGENASGKTNTVEALQLLTSGYSFRHPTPSQLISEGEERSLISARLRGDGRVVDVACEIEPKRKVFYKNGKKCTSKDMPGMLFSILFNPDDLFLVKRGASYRRDEIDAFARQANPNYDKVLSTYLRTVEQRNHLLKEERPDPALLDVWDESLALGGATLLLARHRLFERLQEKVVAAYARIASGEELSMRYAATMGDDLLYLSREEVRDRYREMLRAGRADDLRRQQTLIGPHRDDIEFSIAGREARAYASQGQQRSVVLALKLAEVVLARELVDDQPLLLLDDVMSELDAQRRAAVVSFIEEGIQTIITTTNLGYFSQDMVDAAKVVEF